MPPFYRHGFWLRFRLDGTSKKSRNTSSIRFLVIYQNLVSRFLFEKIETSFSTGHVGAEVSRVWSGEYVCIKLPQLKLSEAQANPKRKTRAKRKKKKMMMTNFGEKKQMTS